MSSTAERLPTFEELYEAIKALPPGLTGEILEPGVIRTMSRPGGQHRFAARRIPADLGDDDAAEGGGSWWLEQEAEVRFPGERLVVPDVSGWHLGPDEPVPPAFVHTNPIERLPNWCCEIPSPTTEQVDREVKLPLYATSGVEWLWLVDPQARRVEVFRVRERVPECVKTLEGMARGPIPPFGAIVDTSRWWLPA